MPESHADARPRFIILDNAVVSLGGHFLDYALAVLKASRMRGFSPTLVTHRSFGDVVPANVEVERLYRFDHWPLASRAPVIRWLRLHVLAKRQPSAATSRGAARAQPSFLRGLRKHYDGLESTVRSRAFARGTTAAFERLRPQPQDLIFLPNPWIPELTGLAAALHSYQWREGLAVHLLLRREFRVSEAAAMREVLCDFSDALPDVRVFFYCDTPELAQLYLETFGPRFETLPIPHPTFGISGRVAGEPIQICFVGDARSEKGFAALPKLVRQVVAKAGSPRTIQFIIQANAPLTGLEPDASAALAELRAMDSSLVSLIAEPQERSAYEATIVNSDVVLLPYEAEHYRYRSSGVLIEALSAGVPVLVPDKTWLANELRRFRQSGHPSMRITEGLPGAIYTAEESASERLGFLLAHIREFQAVARDCAPRVRGRHNAEALVDSLVVRAQLEPLAARAHSRGVTHAR